MEAVSTITAIIAKGDHSRICESFAYLLQTAVDARVKNDLLLKLIDYCKSIPNISLPSLAPYHFPSLLKMLRLLSVDRKAALRSQTLRAIRYMMNDLPFIIAFNKLNIDLFVIRSLERDSKYLWERMQALKLIRRQLSIAPSTITRSVISSLIAIAEHPKDDFRRVSLDVLRELVLICPDLVASCNGIRTIIDSILDPSCADIASSLTLTLLFLLDQEGTRKYLRPSLDVIRLLSRRETRGGVEERLIEGRVFY